MEITSFIFGILSAIVVVFTAGMVFGMVKILARLSSLENFKQNQVETNNAIKNRINSSEKEFYGQLDDRIKSLEINTNSTIDDIYRTIDSRTDKLDNKIRELSTSK